MNYRIELFDTFKKEAKRLNKKYRNLKNDLENISENEIDRRVIDKLKDEKDKK